MLDTSIWSVNNASYNSSGYNSINQTDTDLDEESKSG